MSSKERVLMVHNFYQIGGGEHTVFENEVRLLREHGHKVITYTRDNTEINKLKIRKLFLPLTTTFSLKTYQEVKRIIKSQKIDLVHCHNTFPLISPSVYYAAWKCKVPVIQTIHNFRFICPNGVLFRNDKTCEDCLKEGLICGIKNACYRGSKLQTIVVVNMLHAHRLIGTYKKLHYIFLTDFNREKFRGLLGDKLNRQFTKPNFEYIYLPNDSDNRDESYVFIGRLEKNKGIDFIVDSWGINRELFIFGNGTLEEYVKNACLKNNHIHYMGFQPQKVIWYYLKKATAMLFPTDLYEGFPMTVIESFAFGTPVIYSDIGNGADIVKKENAGVAFKRRNTMTLFEAMQEIEKNFDKYSLNARLAYEIHYMPETNYKQLINIYKAVKNERVYVIDVPISAVNMDTCVDNIFEDFDKDRGKYICVSNVHTTVMAHDDPEYYRIQAESFMSVPDGKPLSVIGRKQYPNMDRVTGPDLIRRIFEESKKRKIRHYFYGNSKENLEKLIEVLKKNWPWLEICGYEPSVFRDLSVKEETELVERINATNPDFVWVALGAPRQEKFCYKMFGRINGLMVGVGGAFNILAGIIPEAPMWMQKLSLEWFYRFIQEPKRLFKRYAITNTKFIWYLITKKERRKNDE